MSIKKIVSFRKIACEILGSLEILEKEWKYIQNHR